MQQLNSPHLGLHQAHSTDARRAGVESSGKAVPSVPRTCATSRVAHLKFLAKSCSVLGSRDRRRLILLWLAVKSAMRFWIASRCAFFDAINLSDVLSLTIGVGFRTCVVHQPFAQGHLNAMTARVRFANRVATSKF